MKIEVDGIVRDMTPEEEMDYMTNIVSLQLPEEAPAPEDYEAALARLGVD